MQIRSVLDCRASSQHLFRLKRVLEGFFSVSLFGVKMWSWKLLGDLEPEELKLECERANLSSSDKVSHNCIKMSKYILSNGYDPETFYFNTHYKADKTSPLMGMSAPAGQFGAVPLPSSNVSPGNVATSSISSPK